MGSPDSNHPSSPRKWGCRIYFVNGQKGVGLGAAEGEGSRRSGFGGRTTILEAVRELVSLAHTDAITNEADRLLIIGIESETDHLPIGEVRKLWAPDALQRKDPEIARAEALWKAEFLDVCKRIAGPNCR
jgi:hypothetical protein